MRSIAIAMLWLLIACGRGPTPPAPHPPPQPVVDPAPHSPPQPVVDPAPVDQTHGETPVNAQAMPQGAVWQGVYFDPMWGQLHLIGQGDAVKGRWQRPAKDRWGELSGTVNGNVVHFEWSEYLVGAVGPDAKKSGKGYLIYRRPPGSDVDDQLDGSMGMGNSDTGMEWHAIKQRNATPDPGYGDDAGGGDFDRGDL